MPLIACGREEGGDSPLVSKRVQRALYWASAEWARRHKRALISDDCFVSCTADVVLERALSAADGAATISEHQYLENAVLLHPGVLCVLDAAIEYVLSQSQEQMDKDIQLEPLWLFSQDGKRLSTAAFIREYERDVTGKLKEIFDSVGGMQVEPVCVSSILPAGGSGAP